MGPGPCSPQPWGCGNHRSHLASESSDPSPQGEREPPRQEPRTRARRGGRGAPAGAGAALGREESEGSRGALIAGVDAAAAAARQQLSAPGRAVGNSLRLRLPLPGNALRAAQLGPQRAAWPGAARGRPPAPGRGEKRSGPPGGGHAGKLWPRDCGDAERPPSLSPRGHPGEVAPGGGEE